MQIFWRMLCIFCKTCARPKNHSRYGATILLHGPIKSIAAGNSTIKILVLECRWKTSEFSEVFVNKTNQIAKGPSMYFCLTLDMIPHLEKYNKFRKQKKGYKSRTLAFQKVKSTVWSDLDKFFTLISSEKSLKIHF